MSNRGQIRDQVRVLIDQVVKTGEDDTIVSRLTDPEINTLIDTAQSFVSSTIAQPRDIISIITENSVGAYPLPSDNLFIKQAWFGDITKSGDVRKLDIISQKALSVLFPSWLESSTTSDGRPSHSIVLDKKTIFIYPKPNSTEAGKRLIVSYVYDPSALDSDLDIPDVPFPYHHLIAIYAAHLCWLGKLQRPDIAKEMLSEYADKLKLIEDPATQEFEGSKTFEFLESADL